MISIQISLGKYWYIFGVTFIQLDGGADKSAS